MGQGWQLPHSSEMRVWLVNMEELTKDYAEELKQLFREYDFSIKEERYYDELFGNATLVLRGAIVSIRIERERSLCFVQLMNAEGEWRDIRDVLFETKSIGSDSANFTLPEYVELMMRYRHVIELAASKSV